VLSKCEILPLAPERKGMQIPENAVTSGSSKWDSERRSHERPSPLRHRPCRSGRPNGGTFLLGRLTWAHQILSKFACSEFLRKTFYKLVTFQLSNLEF